MGLEDLILCVLLVRELLREALTNPLCWKSLSFVQLDLHPYNHLFRRERERGGGGGGGGIRRLEEMGIDYFICIFERRHRSPSPGCANI